MADDDTKAKQRKVDSDRTAAERRRPKDTPGYRGSSTVNPGSQAYQLSQPKTDAKKPKSMKGGGIGPENSKQRKQEFYHEQRLAAEKKGDQKTVNKIYGKLKQKAPDVRPKPADKTPKAYQGPLGGINRAADKAGLGKGGWADKVGQVGTDMILGAEGSAGIGKGVKWLAGKGGQLADRMANRAASAGEKAVASRAGKAAERTTGPSAPLRGAKSAPSMRRSSAPVKKASTPKRKVVSKPAQAGRTVAPKGPGGSRGNTGSGLKGLGSRAKPAATPKKSYDDSALERAQQSKGRGAPTPAPRGAPSPVPAKPKAYQHTTKEEDQANARREKTAGKPSPAPSPAAAKKPRSAAEMMAELERMHSMPNGRDAHPAADPIPPKGGSGYVKTKLAEAKAKREAAAKARGEEPAPKPSSAPKPAGKKAKKGTTARDAHRDDAWKKFKAANPNKSNSELYAEFRTKYKKPE